MGGGGGREAAERGPLIDRDLACFVALLIDHLCSYPVLCRFSLLCTIRVLRAFVLGVSVSTQR